MRIIAYCLLFLVCSSCNNNNNVPKDVLSKDKMRTVLWDMLRADEWVNYEQNKDTATNRDARSKELYQKVFQVNGITAAQFKRSFQYYQNHPDQLKPLLDSLQHRGTILPGAAIQ